MGHPPPAGTPGRVAVCRRLSRGNLLIPRSGNSRPSKITRDGAASLVLWARNKGGQPPAIGSKLSYVHDPNQLLRTSAAGTDAVPPHPYCPVFLFIEHHFYWVRI